MTRKIATAEEIREAVAKEFGDRVRAEIVGDTVEVQTYIGEVPSTSVLFYIEGGDWIATASTTEPYAMSGGLPGDRAFLDIDTVAADIHWAVCSIEDVMSNGVRGA